MLARRTRPSLLSGLSLNTTSVNYLYDRTQLYFHFLFSIAEWVLTGWPETGCDLWEEVRSDDFFWNRMAFIYCLGVAADFSDRIGESMGDTYRATAEDIKVGT